MKEIINFDENRFEIRVMPHREAHGLYLIREGYPDHLLIQSWSEQECRDFITRKFIGEKGTKLQLKIQKSKVVKDDEGFLHLEPMEE